MKSSVIRLVKRAFQDEGISMPDEACEVIFPKGISAQMLDSEKQEEASKNQKPFKEPLNVIAETKTGLRTEAENIKEQAEQARAPEGGKNLLKS